MIALALLSAGLAAGTFTAAPAALRPEPGAKASLTLVLPGANGVLPRLSASVGALENLRALGPDQFASDYLPPDEAIPQVALLGAVGGGEALFLALPLFGLGDAEVKTRPRGRISVTIGDQRFGPVRADQRGLAQVPVVVPPGIREAFHGDQPIDLHVPPTRAVHLVLLQETAAADRPQEVQARLFVVDQSGTPRLGARLVLSASAGEAGTAVEVGAGVYSATWRLGPGPAGEETLSAALEDAPEFVAQARVARRAGPAATLVLRADRQTLTAGQDGEGPLSVTLHATLRDAAGNPADDRLQVSASPGAALVSALGAGEAEAVISLPPRFEGASALLLEARCERGSATAALSLPLLPAAAAVARIEPSLPSVRADGAGRLPLRVLVADRFGNPVQAAVETAADSGAAGPATAEGVGVYALGYLPPVLRERGSALVRVRAGDAEASVRVQLSPEPHRLALTPKLGALSNFGRIASPLLGLEASLRFDLLGLPFAALAEAGWFFSSHSDQPVGTPAVSTREDYLVLSAGLSLRPFVGDRTQAFFSASPSLTLLRSGQQFAGQPQLTSGATTPGLLLAAGLEHRFGRFVPLVEARFSFSGDPALTTIQQPVRGFALVFGGRFELG